MESRHSTAEPPRDPMKKKILKIQLRKKKKEILPFATTWMDLESIMLSEISQRKTNAI